MMQSSQARFQCDCMKVEKETGRTSAEFQRCDDLCQMHRHDPLDGFDFDDQAVIDNQVQFEVMRQSMPPVRKVHAALSLDTQLRSCDLNRKTLGINGFEQSGTEGTVHVDRTADNRFCQ